MYYHQITWNEIKKIIPSTIASKRNKAPSNECKKKKKVQDLFTENYKIPLREIIENLNGETSHAHKLKDSILFICQFPTNYRGTEQSLSKSHHVFVEIDKLILVNMWTWKGPRQPKQFWQRTKLENLRYWISNSL